MSKDNDAFALYEKALNIQFSTPKKALDLLWEAAQKYPNTLTVHNYVLDMLISIAQQNHFWDDAIRACSLAQQLKPDYQESYALEAEACQLDKDGKFIGALDKRFRKDTRYGKWFGTVRDYGNKFADLGAHDRAWKLYNEAIVIAVQDGTSPHTVRVSMANLLLKENNPIAAIEQLLVGICEAEQFAKKGAPKSLITSLRKALKIANLNSSELTDKLVDRCKSKGQTEALALLRELVK